jgi:FkbM family methyltransferase
VLKLIKRARYAFYFRVIRKISFRRSLKRIYVQIFARPRGQRINDALLSYALAGRGYNNCCDIKTTGEATFLRTLFVTNPKLCIDVGANIGNYTEYILKNSTAHVISFEPLPVAFERLRRLEDKYPGRLESRNVGVGDREGMINMFYGPSASELATFSPEVNQIDYVGKSNINSSLAKVITLDSLTDSIKSEYDIVDLLKIDTEGYEYNVLEGAKRFISELKPRFIQIEFNLHQLFVGNSLKSIATLLPEYRVHQLLPYGNGMVERNPDFPESNIYHYSNFVFERGNDT